MQVQPGSDTLSLTARATAPVDKLLARLPEDWVRQEIWSYEATPALRVTGVSGAVQVDPRQADVPPGWLGLPAYALADGDALVIDQRSRGAESEVANRLTLQREAWLDFSGRGWFARDVINGRMQNGWRFDVVAPLSVQRAEAGDQGDDALLVTRGASAGSNGVEWRSPAVNLHAGVSIDSGMGSMPITGWQQVFDQVSTTVHLPYGYRLIAAPGTDRANGSWLSSWSLLDVFVAAILVLLASRLIGRAGGVVVALYLLLGYQESGSPLWTLLAVLALALVVRALPEGRLARLVGVSHRAAVVLLVLIALPFAANQLRQALHPQLESQRGIFHDLSESAYPVAPIVTGEAPPPAPQAPAAPMPPEAVRAPPPEGNAGGADRSRSAASDELETVTVTGSRIRRGDLIGKYSETTVVQTGSGEPSWQLGSRHTLNWSGPVLSTQQVRLVIMPPWLVRPLRIALVGLLGFLLWRLVRTPARRKAGLASAVGGVAIAMSALLFTPVALAQDYPPEALLQQLRQGLIEAPRCAPQCAGIAHAQVSARGDEIRVALEVHAAERVAVPLPADDKGLALRTITLDGIATEAVVRHDDRPWIAVERGVHRVELAYLPTADKIALAFSMAPHRVRLDAQNWQATGLADQQLLTETLTLVRSRDSSDPVQAAGGAQQFAPYVRVERRLQLDLEWTIHTTVHRLAPREGGFTVSVPTIAGEHVTTPGLKVHDGMLTAALANGAAETAWHSTLDQAEAIALTAAALTDHAEVWRVVVSPTWHVDFSGVPEAALAADTDLDDVREFVFHPLPGETLGLRVSKPTAVAGATRAIDRLDLTSDFGQRATTHVLRFNLRASQGGEQAIGLPGDAEVLGASRDGVQIGAHAIDGRLSLPLAPGAQTYEVRFRENLPIPLSAHTPRIALGLPAANIVLSINLPEDRWLLAAFGPPVGPVLLFWGELLLMIVVAWLLSRWRRTDLRFHHWLLLGLGFSTYSWFALALVVAWLLALDWRKRHSPTVKWQFNLAQIALVGLTAVALGCLLASIKNGLLGAPDMVVSGNGSSAGNLQWFADRSVDALPTATVFSLPLWTYNLIMLVWALWLAWATVGWLGQGFVAWTSGGYWRPRAAVKQSPASS